MYDKEIYQKYKATSLRCNKVWVSNNREHYNDLMKTVMKKHYINNKDKISAYKKQLYQYKKEVNRMMGMYSVYE